MEVKPGYKQTEVGVLPEEWESLPFNDLGTVIDGDRGVNYPSAQDFSDNGHCLFLNAGNVTKDGFRFDECTFITREKDQKLSKGKLKRQDIVLTTRGTVGNFAYFDTSIPFDNLRINSGMVILRSESSVIAPEFLYALLQSHSVGMQIERLSFGSAQPQLTVKGVSKLGIVVPPIAEQSAIAEALSDIDALLTRLDQLIAKKRDLKQAAMQQLLTGQTRLPGFHGEWVDTPLRKICTLFNGRAYALHEWETSGTPVIRLQNLTGGDEYYYSTLQLPEQKYCSYGDLLYMWSATFGPHLWKGEKAIYHYHIWKVVPIEERATRDFLFYKLLEITEEKKARAANGGTMLHVTKTSMESTSVALPPLPEQIAITAVLSDLDAELWALEQRQEKTRDLKQAMMQELLTGKTRLV
jgi:type I restriction enzyme S subunit